MTTTVTQQVLESYTQLGYEALTQMVGLIAITLLIALMVEKEVLRTVFERERVDELTKVLNVAIFPLLVAFGLIVTVRLLYLIR